MKWLGVLLLVLFGCGTEVPECAFRTSIDRVETDAEDYEDYLYAFTVCEDGIYTADTLSIAELRQGKRPSVRWWGLGFIIQDLLEPKEWRHDSNDTAYYEWDSTSTLDSIRLIPDTQYLEEVR